MALFYLFKRELKSLLVSPLAYAAGVVFLTISGYFFSVILLATRVADMRPYFLNLGVILLLITPLITMRSLAEERQGHTDELLMTLPLTPTQVVLGKYLAVLALWVGLLLVTGAYAAVLAWLADPPLAPILTSYLGAVLLGGTFLSVGVFTSSLTDSQMVAGVLCFGLLLMLWVINWLAYAVPGVAGEVARQLSVFDRFDDFTKGLVDSTHLVFYLSVIGLLLFLSVRSLERRTWM